MISFRISPLTLEIADGDLAAQTADAAVNAANNAFWMGSGVAGALKARGGRSIAFPAFGTVVGGFGLKDCARLMIEAIRAHDRTATSLRLVRLVLFGRPAYRAFVDLAGELMGAPLDGPPDCPVSG